MKIRWAIAWIFLFCIPLAATLSELPAKHIAPVPLDNAYAHNDYWHKRPLFDALENGFTNFEVDIYHIGNEFIVSHLFPLFQSERTLEKLYLQPLQQHISKNQGQVYTTYHKPVILMIDIKMNGNRTYAGLKGLLEKYSSILTSYENGVLTERQVTVVISGSKPYAIMRNESKRFAFIDEDLEGIATSRDMPLLSPVASCRYSSLLAWNGYGVFPDKEKQRLISFVNSAHKQGKKVRLWASPERKEVWRELLACGVDLINTDRLADLRLFLATNADYLFQHRDHRVKTEGSLLTL